MGNFSAAFFPCVLLFVEVGSYSVRVKAQDIQCISGGGCGRIITGQGGRLQRIRGEIESESI